MKRAFKVGFAVLLLLTSIAAHAQMDIPVNLVTGAAQIGIPLGEVRDNEISVPITLSYNATGVQISEKGYGEFGFGANWALRAGGSITREIRALPDDFMGLLNDPRKGWLIGNTAQTMASYAQGGALESFKYADTEPDMFSIGVPGLSVKFVFDNTKQIRTIPYQDVKIVPYYTDAINKADIYKFEVTTNDGVKYEFAEQEITNKYASDYNYPIDQNKRTGFFTREYDLYGIYKPTFFKSSWHLSKITTRDNRTILVKYTDAKPFTYSEDKILTTDLGESYYLFTTYNTTFRKRLVEVSSATSRAYFNFNQGNFQAYDRIDFFDNTSGQEKRVKSYSLNYKNVFSKETTLSASLIENSMRRFLESISESSDCSIFPSQKFSYYGVDFATGITQLPPPGSSKQDMWGYFNDSSDDFLDQNINMHPLTPEMHYYNLDVPGYTPKYLPDQIPGSVEKYGQNYSIDVGRKRSVNPATIHLGSLSKIQTPFGGYTSIEYEPNNYRYQLPELGELIPFGEGIRVKKVIVHDGIAHTNDQVKEYEYQDADGKSSGRITYPPQFDLLGKDAAVVRSISNLAPSSEIFYKRVTVKEVGKGKLVCEYLVPAVYPTVLEGDWKASTNFQYPFSPNTEYSFERGLPYRKYEYKESDMVTPLHETQYEYQRISLQPTEVKAVNFDSPVYYDLDFKNDFVWSPTGGTYKHITNVGKVLLSEKNFTTDPSNKTRKMESASSYFYEATTHKLLTRTTVENSDGSTYETRFKYVKDFAGITTPGDPTTTALKVMNENYMHTAPVETVTWLIKGTSSKVLSASLTKYNISAGGLALPAQIRQLPQVVGYTAASIQPVNGSQKLVEDSRYITVKEFETYQGIKPLTINDGKGRLHAFHWGYSATTPVVEIVNAAANQVAFSNFETTTNNNFTLVNPTYVPGNILGKALSLPANTIFQANVQKGLGKYYRFTCRIKAAASGALTIQLSNGNTNFITESISFNASSNWQFIEKQLDVTAAASTFTIKASGSVALVLDDIAFSPSIASIQSFTFDSALGKTSETDSKGILR